MKTIELETTFSPWTLDTYQTFTFRHAENSEIDSWSRELGLDLCYDDFKWSYDTEGHLQALAEELESILKDYILDDVIKDVNFDGVSSPRQYNFTTDKAWAQWEVDKEKLDEYIEENKEHYRKNKISSGPGFTWLGDEEQTKLNYYLKEESTKLLSKWDAIEYLHESVWPGEFMEMEVKDEVLENADMCPECDKQLEEVYKVQKQDAYFEVDLATGEETHKKNQATVNPVVYLCPKCEAQVSEDCVADLEAIKQYKKQYKSD